MTVGIRCHGTPNGDLDRPADHRGVSMGYGASLHDPRSRRRLWDGRAGAPSLYGDYGSADRTALALAIAVGRARHRFDPARMSRSCHRPERKPSSADPGILPGLLSSLPMSPVARQGCALRTACTAGRKWRDRGVPASRRTASPLRAPRGPSQPWPMAAETVEVHHRRSIPGPRVEAGFFAHRMRATRLSWRRDVPRDQERLRRSDR